VSIWSDIAEWIGPTQNRYPGGMGAVAGVVLHIQDGSEAGTEAWQRNPSAQVSSHFLAPRAGGLKQMVDTRDAAWAEVSGNLRWISIENEGYGGQPLTDGQIEACAKVLARAHVVYGVPLQPCDDPLLPGAAGLTGHGKGGAAWGGHYDCPGNPVLAQRAAIIERAATLLGTTPTPTPTPASPSEPPTPTQEDDDMPAFATGDIKPGDGALTMVLVPPANFGSAGWGNVWFSLGADFGEAHVRVAIYTHGQGWSHIYDDDVVKATDDRVNPFGGPLPQAVQKISITRAENHDVPLAYLVEATAKPVAS